MINRIRLVEAFMKYVQISSPTKNEGAFAKFIKVELEKLGLEVAIDHAGEKVGSDTGNIIANLEGTREGEPILLSCHMDTVSPGVDIKPLIKEDTIYSDGTTILGADDKAGIAAILEALAVIKENNLPHGPVEISFSIFEEGGLYGAKNLDFKQFKSQQAFIFDSSGDPGQIIIQGPAQDKIHVTIKGKPAHAGVCPEEGISAIMVAANAINQMKLLRIDSETTANIGSIQGGSATNIVTPEVQILAEARSLDNDKLKAQSNHMKACFESAADQFGAKAEVQINRMYDAFKIDAHDEIVKKVEMACTSVGIKPSTASSGGGSDTNVFNTNGIKAINLGIGARKPHTLDEHIHINDLVKASELVLEIIRLS
ncbi:M20/M25/M40 family metallo-hydrolase [Fusibacter ferrireducens]|uniref:M20/M25/M40 family metallo-hydrolase n=1 Tax=Fusibacter ferrireducens TaxID=2785058 RepID=A0ABR9ZWL0_9FIRM|nr:M20/M25/M40 family metallo-hydrolase [Fusibacter ferrireducens]MBF4694533.1 M20/M25/M40 family metallo-hydrolase [Fusibacter ferrireducens]